MQEDHHPAPARRSLDCSYCSPRSRRSFHELCSPFGDTTIASAAAPKLYQRSSPVPNRIVTQPDFAMAAKIFSTSS